jgi:hypothetical protein
MVDPCISADGRSRRDCFRYANSSVQGDTWFKKVEIERNLDRLARVTKYLYDYLDHYNHQMYPELKSNILMSSHQQLLMIQSTDP